MRIKNYLLSEVADILPSNVDKKINPTEAQVRLCNYMDVYNNRYLHNKLYFSPGSATLQEIKKFNLKKGDVIITKDSETPDDIAIPTYIVENIPNLVCGYHLALIRPNPEYVYGRFLMHKLQSNISRKYFSNRANGSTRYGLSFKVLADLPLEIPPLPTQHKIAQILSTIDGQIEKTEAIIAKYQAIKQGMLQDLFTRGVDVKTGKLRPRYEDAPELYKPSELGMVPQEWVITSVGSETSIIRGASPRPKGDLRYYGPGVPRLMVEDVTRDGKYVTPSVDSLTLEGAKLSRLVPKNTLTLVCSGIVGVPSFLFVEACIHDGFIAVLNFSKSYLSDYLYYFFKFLQSSIDKFATHGGIFTNLTTTIVKDIKIPLLDFNEQAKIVRVLNNIENCLSLEFKLLFKLKLLKQGLMSDLLSGKVDVRAEAYEEINSLTS